MEFNFRFSVISASLWMLIGLFAGNLTAGIVQTGQGGKIHDFSGSVQADSFHVEVKGVSPATLSRTFGLSKICIDIVHHRTSDLKIELISPSGVSIWLTNRNGGENGWNYTSTCFRSNGFSGYVHKGKNPFVGEYIPDGRIEFLNNGQNPNGKWTLLISDLRSGESGQLNYFSLEFSENPTPNYLSSPCQFENGKACQCPDGKSTCDLLPDLIILPKFTEIQVEEYPYDHVSFPGQLKFAASIANIGSGPMEILGSGKWYCNGVEVKKSAYCGTDSIRPRQLIYQRIYQRTDTGLSSRLVTAGTNYFDDKPGHNHFHVDDWVLFQLVSYKDTVHFKGKKVICKGQKVSYCLFDSGICNNEDSLCQDGAKVYGEKNLLNYGLGDYSGCEAPAQGISVGGYDTYGFMYEGQYLVLPKGLKTGFYWLEILIDPTGKYIESNKENNIYRQRVFVSKQMVNSKSKNKSKK